MSEYKTVAVIQVGLVSHRLCGQSGITNSSSDKVSIVSHRLCGQSGITNSSSDKGRPCVTHAVWSVSHNQQ